MCVCAEWIRAIFLSSGRTGVREGGQYGARGSQDVQLTKIGEEGAKEGRKGVRVALGCWVFI